MNANKFTDALTRKLGPLPAWAWLAIFGAAVYWYRRRKGTSPIVGTVAAPTTSDSQSPRDATVLQPGESAYDPNTGQLISTAPEQQPPATVPDSQPPVNIAAGECVYDPSTGKETCNHPPPGKKPKPKPKKHPKPPPGRKGFQRRFIGGHWRYVAIGTPKRHPKPKAGHGGQGKPSNGKSGTKKPGDKSKPRHGGSHHKPGRPKPTVVQTQWGSVEAPRAAKSSRPRTPVATAAKAPPRTRAVPPPRPAVQQHHTPVRTPAKPPARKRGH